MAFIKVTPIGEKEKVRLNTDQIIYYKPVIISENIESDESTKIFFRTTYSDGNHEVMNVNESVDVIDALIRSEQVLAGMIEIASKNKPERKNFSIYEMGLTTRTVHALARHGIFGTDDLANLKEGELERIRNLGTKSMIEVIEKCKKFGLERTW